MMAGTMTAIIATTVVFASTARLPERDNPLLASSAPAASVQAPLQPMEAAPREAAPMEAETLEDVPMDAPPVRMVEPPADETDDLALIIESPVEPIDQPLTDQPPPPIEPEVRVGDPTLEPPPLEEVPQAAPTPPPPAPEPPPVRIVQAPSAAAPDPNAPLQLNPVVGGLAPTASPTQVLIPPLPRIRPR
jgi:hypothetical protein